MCGIYGALHPRGDLRDAMTAMRDLLRHRGPDAEGMEEVPRGILGHLRLSIIDLSTAGAQPMWDADRRACVTFNGEIYNFRELRSECERAGMEFRSASDTEVIVNQFLLHGERAFDRLNGIFALCLFDAESGDFYLARDPMGVKPLYYAETPEAIFFASELKALVRTGVVRPEVDPAALQAYLQLDFVPAPLAMVRGVRKLREGHLLRVRAAGGIEVRAYSSLQSREEEPERRSTIAADVAEFDRLIHRAVGMQLVSDVPLGVFLSGGIDSSIVAQAAAEVAGRRISTFSISFEDRSFDESSYFDEVAKAIGSDHHTEVLGPRAMMDLIPSLPDVACEPLADGSIFPTMLLCRFARRHVTVALSGDGADEILAGYPTYHAARLARPLRFLPRSAAAALPALARAVLPVSYDNLSFDFRVKKLLEGLHPDPLLRNARWLGSFRSEDLPSLMSSYDPALQADLERMLREPARPVKDRAPLEALLRMDQRFYLQDGVLVKVDRASMACSLEVRVPFLDPGIVAFARSLPADRKLAGKDFKHLLKVYGAGRLPAPVLARPKKGFGTPLGKWFRKELKGFLGDALAPARLESQGFFRGAFVRRLLEDHWSGRRDNRKLLFNLLTFTLWFASLGEAGRRGSAGAGKEGVL